jgi:hypothetical protein
VSRVIGCGHPICPPVRTLDWAHFRRRTGESVLTRRIEAQAMGSSAELCEEIRSDRDREGF